MDCAVKRHSPGCGKGTGMMGPWRWMFWEVSQGVGMESYTTCTPCTLPAGLVPTPHAPGTHSGLRTLLSNGELCPADTTQLLISMTCPQSLHSNPYCCPYILNTRNTIQNSPHFYPAVTEQLLPPRTDRPSYYRKALLRKGKWLLNCIPTCLLQDLHHRSFLLELVFL